jgi:hypothetical protein
MTDKPDFYAEPQGNHIVLVANKKARRVIDGQSDSPFPWGSFKGSKFLTSVRPQPRLSRAKEWEGEMTEQPPPLPPQAALQFILMRYDHDAGMAPGVWAVVLELQRHLSWLEHIQRARLRDRAQAQLGRQDRTALTSRMMKGK